MTKKELYSINDVIDYARQLGIKVNFQAVSYRIKKHPEWRQKVKEKLFYDKRQRRSAYAIPFELIDPFLDDLQTHREGQRKYYKHWKQRTKDST